MKQFKNVLATMMMAVALCLSACGSDSDGDDNDGPDSPDSDSIEALIIGTWENSEPPNNYFSYTFHADGTYEGR